MPTDRHSRADADGFTLIELLIVVVVIGILAGIVGFAVGAFRSDASNAACKTDARTIATAKAAYAVQHPGSADPTVEQLVDGGYISAPSSACELAFTPDPPASDTPTLSVTASGSTTHPGAPNTPDYTASVTITVTDQDHVVVAGAVVAGAWDDGASPSGCTTAADGSCTFVSPHSTPNPNQDVPWHLSSVTKDGYDQASGAVVLHCSRHNNAGGTQVCT